MENLERSETLRVYTKCGIIIKLISKNNFMRASEIYKKLVDKIVSSKKLNLVWNEKKNMILNINKYIQNILSGSKKYQDMRDQLDEEVYNLEVYPLIMTKTNDF